MTDLNITETKREQALNKALEALHFGFRAVVARPDAMLTEYKLSRIHHRIVYFIGRNPGLSVNELLAILSISKQSLNLPLRQLTQLELIESKNYTIDRRLKRLKLTQQGSCLENQLSGEQRERFAQVFEIVGPEGEEAWRTVMRLLADRE